MKKKILGVVIVAIAVLMMAIPVFAAPNLQGAPYRNLDNSVALYLYEKDPSNEYAIVDGGAIGKVTLKNGAFTGHGLEPNTEYTLFNYAGWGEEGVILGEGTTNNGGNIQINADMTLELEEEIIGKGAKIWLVLTADLGDDAILDAWNPTEYLFEYNTIPV